MSFDSTLTKVGCDLPGEIFFGSRALREETVGTRAFGGETTMMGDNSVGSDRRSLGSFWIVVEETSFLKLVLHLSFSFPPFTVRKKANRPLRSMAQPHGDPRVDPEAWAMFRFPTKSWEWHIMEEILTGIRDIPQERFSDAQGSGSRRRSLRGSRTLPGAHFRAHRGEQTEGSLRRELAGSDEDGPCLWELVARCGRSATGRLWHLQKVR